MATMNDTQRKTTGSIIMMTLMLIVVLTFSIPPIYGAAPASRTPMLPESTAKSGDIGISAPFPVPVPSNASNDSSPAEKPKYKPANVSIIAHSEDGFSVVFVQQQINDTPAEDLVLKQGNMTEIIKRLSPQLSIVAPKGANISDEALTEYVRALNEQTKGMNKDIREKIEAQDADIATEVVRRELTRKVSQQAFADVTAQQVNTTVQPKDPVADQQKVDALVRSSEPGFFQRLYLLMTAGIVERTSLQSELAEYSMLAGKKPWISLQQSKAQLVKEDLSPQQAIDLVYRS